MKLSTSNKNKIKEYQQYIPELEVIKGPDIKEVEGTSKEVIIYKSKDMGTGFLVEDTILIVNEKEIVDIRWKINELKEGDKASWITRIAYNDGENISVYKGEIEGRITKEQGSKGFAFDPFFIPKGSSLTLTQLGERKRLFSARFNAIQNLIKDKKEFSIEIEKIKPWSGKYQNKG